MLHPTLDKFVAEAIEDASLAKTAQNAVEGEDRVKALAQLLRRGGVERFKLTCEALDGHTDILRCEAKAYEIEMRRDRLKGKL